MIYEAKAVGLFDLERNSSFVGLDQAYMESAILEIPLIITIESFHHNEVYLKLTLKKSSQPIDCSPSSTTLAADIVITQTERNYIKMMTNSKTFTYQIISC